jgi:hypothetical protein
MLGNRIQATAFMYVYPYLLSLCIIFVNSVIIEFINDTDEEETSDPKTKRFPFCVHCYEHSTYVCNFLYF